MATSMRLPAAPPPTREVKSASSSATRRLVPRLLLASAVLNGYHIWWGLPLTRPIALEATHVAPVESARGKESRDQENVVAWGTDEVAPMGPLVYAKRTFTGGSCSQKYPAFHFMLLNAAYAPVLGYLFLSGQISLAHLSDSWPYGLKDPVSSLTLLVLIARAVSVAMGTAIVGLTYLITERLFGGIAGIFTALILALCPMFIYYSHTSNLDIPYLFWFVLGCVFYVRLFEGGQTRDYVLFGVCMALTVATKDQAYALLPLLPVSLILSRMRRRTDGVAPSGDGGSPPSIPWRKLGLSLVAFLATYAVAANIPNNWSGYLRHVQHITGPGSAQYQEFPGTLSGQGALLSRTIALLAKTMNVPLFVVCAVGIVWGLVRFRRGEPGAPGSPDLLLWPLHRRHPVCLPPVPAAARARVLRLRRKTPRGPLDALLAAAVGGPAEHRRPAPVQHGVWRVGRLVSAAGSPICGGAMAGCARASDCRGGNVRTLPVPAALPRRCARTPAKPRRVRGGGVSSARARLRRPDIRVLQANHRRRGRRFRSGRIPGSALERRARV